MKKLLYSLLTLAAALTVTSCMKEQPVSADPTQGGPTVDATFSLNLSQALTKAAADGSKATKLSYFFYDEKGNKIDALSQVNGAIPTEGKINVKLSRGVAYTFAAWAQADGAPYSINEDGKTVTMNTANLTANNDNYDAFYVNATITAEDTKTTVSKELDLTRPFAQVNVLVPNGNIASDYQTFKSSMTVKGVKTSMNLMDGTLTGEATNVAFGEAGIADINETSIKDNHKYLAMNYVFAPADAATFDVDFTVTPQEVTADAATVSLKNVSLQRNRRTNLVGNIFKTQVDGTITITIGGNQWDSEVEEGISLPDVTVNTVAVGGSVPVAISGNSATTLTLNSNSTGDVTVDQPEKPEVATTSYDSSTGTITVTPKGNGNTTFVAHIAAGETKAALRAVDITFVVTVTNYNGGDTQAPVQLEMGSVSCTGVNENTLTFTWTAVVNASGYKVSTDGGNTYGETINALTYTWEGLNASTSYTLYVKAIGDGQTYTDSDPATGTGTTKTGGVAQYAAIPATDITLKAGGMSGNVNGKSGYKLGTSNDAQSITIAAGYSSISLYGAGWASGTNTITVTNGTIEAAQSATLTNDSSVSGNINNNFTLTGIVGSNFIITVTDPENAVVISVKRGVIWDIQGI